MFDPLDIEAMDEVRFITGCTIKPSLVLESEIKDAIRKYYDGETVVRKPEQSPFKQASPGGKMELSGQAISNMERTSSSDASSPILSSGDNAKQTLEDYRIRLDTIISLLIERSSFHARRSSDMIYQKKMGM